MDPYSYVGGNPETRTDPTGQFDDPEADGGGYGGQAGGGGADGVDGVDGADVALEQSSDAASYSAEDETLAQEITHEFSSKQVDADYNREAEDFQDETREFDEHEAAERDAAHHGPDDTHEPNDSHESDADDPPQESHEQDEPTNRNAEARTQAKVIRDTLKARADAKKVDLSNTTVGVGITGDGTNLISVNQRWTEISTESLEDSVAGIMKDITGDLQNEGTNALYVGPDELIYKVPGTYITALHAEDYIMQTVEDLDYDLEGIGASRFVCPACFLRITATFPALELDL